jgi:lipopolysaccharide biosynthesis glycosyltransferase
MKLAIVTRADKNILEMCNITLPPMRKYADKIGADFIQLDHQPPIMTDDNKTHYRIIKVRELLEEYDRILCLDADMLINKNIPNIFDVVPYEKMGSIFEDKGSRRGDRLNKILNIQKHWGNVNWKENYTNAGTFVLSKIHRDIFLPHNSEYWVGWGSADLHMSYMSHKLGFEIMELPFKWNHMTMFSEPWNNHADRFQSYIIHYAGRGIFDGNIRTRLEQIKNDNNKIYGN